MSSSGVMPPLAKPREQRRYVPGTGWESKVPRVASWFCYFTALLSLVTAIIPRSRGFLRPLSGLVDLVFISSPPNLAWAVLMAILASALGKRKRAAWGLLIALEVFELIILFSAWYWFPSAFPIILTPIIIDLLVVAIFLMARREFFAISQKGNGWRALAVFIVGLIVSIAIGALVIGFVGSPEDKARRVPVAWSEFIDVLEQYPSAREQPIPRLSSLTSGILGGATFIATAYVFFRPRRKDRMLSGEDEVEIRELLADFGERDSLGYFATRRDKSAVFAPSGKAVVTYRVVMGVSLAAGDPVGDPDAWPAAIEMWIEEAHRHAWAPAAMGASKQGAEAYRRAGMGAIELGDEAILEFRDWELDGRHMRSVRQAVSRVERAGYTVRVRRHSDIPQDEMNEAIDAADRWRDTDGERGFSMALGRLGDPLDQRCVLVECFDKDGEVAALLNFSPWGDRGLSLDLMRRSRDSENGVIEYMVASLVAAGPAVGVDRLSLNFAVMRAVFAEGSRIGAGPIIRLMRGFLVFASRWYQLESLYRSNAKYQPDWFPRYLLFENTGDLPRVGIAAAMAEGFVTPPSLKTWLAQRRGQSASPLRVACADSPVELMAAAEAKRAELSAVEATVLEADPYRGMPEQEKFRRLKLAQMRERGIDPYVTSFERDATVAQIRGEFGELGVDERTGRTVKIAGRVLLNRVGGKLCFATIRDWTGDIQIMISLAEAGPDGLAAWKGDVDLGDIVGVEGEVITSKRGELSVLVADFLITSKCLVPLPDKHKGLSDPEARVRQRYVDMIVNPEARDMLAMRSTMVRAIRESMWRRDFLEVETPMLQRVHGGANARPFLTHINAYDLRLYLRIAPELFLKRLLVGGVEKVFELNRNFRNEGADSTHNPEFTSMEMYDAYGNYDTMRVLTRTLILEAATAVHGSPIARRPKAGSDDGAVEEVDLSVDWPVITVHDGISQALGESVTPDTDLATLSRLCERAGIPRDPAWDTAHVILEMYEHLCEAKTTSPVFWTDFPTEVSPLTRQKPSEPRVAERWDLVAWGAELGTAYTELIDPLEQRDRLSVQSLLAAAGDTEAMEVDEDFLRALEYGMPPAGGQGMGIDRLIMLLTGKNIRDTVLFPLTRPDQQ